MTALYILSVHFNVELKSAIKYILTSKYKLSVKEVIIK